MIGILTISSIFICLFSVWYYFDVYRYIKAVELTDMVLFASMRYYLQHFDEFEQYYELEELPSLARITYSLTPIKVESYLKPESIAKLKDYFIDSG